MKSIFTNICLLLILLASCTDKEVMDATFTLEVRGYAEEECFTFGEEQPLYLWASKNWADSKLSEVTYAVDPNALETYNAEEGTNLKLLPESCYRIEENTFEVDDESQQAKFKMYYSPEQIIAEGGKYNEVEYALPIRISVNGVPMEDRYGSVIVGFRVNEALISIRNTESVPVITIDNAVSQEVAMTFETNYNNIEWIKLDFTVGGDLVDEYNAAHGTTYEPFPMADISYLTDEFELEREVNVDSALFYADMVNLDRNKEYLLAIRLNSIDTKKCQIDPEKNTRYLVFNNPRIDQTMWKVTTSSTGEGSAANLNDNDRGTHWLWNYNASKLPEDITYTLVDYDQLAVIEKIDLYPAASYNTWTGAKDIEIWVTKDLEEWTKVKDYTAELDPATGRANEAGYSIELDEPTECLAIRIRVTSTYDPQSGNGLAFFEIYMNGKLVENPNPPVITKIPQEAWTVATSTTSSGSAANINDDDLSTFWLWQWQNYKLPENITYTLNDQNQTATIEKIEVYPYNTGNPAWLGAKTIEVQVQEGDTWKTIKTYDVALTDDGLANSAGFTIELDEPVQCKAIRLSVTELQAGTNGLSFAEIYMHGSLTE